MDINDILNDLGLDFSNAETKRGAIEAIEAILDSRTPDNSFGGGGGGATGGTDTEEIEIDPDLLQPSKKHPLPDSDDLDTEIEDEENLISQIKHNDSDQNDFDSDSENSSSNSSDNSNRSTETNSEDNGQAADSEKDSLTDDETIDNDTDPEPELDNDSESETGSDSESAEDLEDAEDADSTHTLDSSENPDDIDNLDSDDQEETELDSEFDEDDLLDDTLKNIYADKAAKAKHEARRIKRERTLKAAKKALEDAKSRKTAPALIHELERAIAALEEITEAINKNLKDLSDDEFNLLVNRVFDAIDAIGDSGLTFKTDAERELQAKEIKNDIASTSTQAELSAEDVAQIRAENQAVKARELENNKYKKRARDSFKGFQDFLDSLYRAIALQVHIDEVQDDTWSALNRRHSGSGVLQPGKRIQELPNKKIPVIDFYFDCSPSWGSADLAIGKKAVGKLADLEAEGQIKINIYYFAHDVFSDEASARAQSGTSAWNEIVKNVISTQATNVIIMTDSDMENWWRGPTALSYTVPGYVWYLWRNGENAPRLPRDLKGRGGTQQFSFSHDSI